MPGLVILYATVSGNAEELAARAAERLRAAGHRPAVSNVADYPAASLQEAGTALLIASTWGEGAAPPDAAEFAAGLAQVRAGAWPHLQFAVLALGSSMYPDFCAFGRHLDAELERVGGRRLVPRADCDTKYAADFSRWLEAVLTVLPVPS